MNEIANIAIIAPPKRYTLRLLSGTIGPLPLLDESGHGEIWCPLGSCPSTAIRHEAMRWAFAARVEVELMGVGGVRIRAARPGETPIVDALVGFKRASL